MRWLTRNETMKKGVTMAVPTTTTLRSFLSNSTTSSTANINAASEFRVCDRTIETMPKMNRKMYQALLLARPNKGINRQIETRHSTAPDVPTLFEASTGTTP